MQPEDIERERIFDEAFRTIAQGEIRTALKPVIFTSCQKAHAEEFVAANPDYAVIHSTPAGKRLEELQLFKHMSPKLAYLHWFYLSARFVIENDFPQDVLFFGNLDNPSSTAFGIESVLLYHAKPKVQSLTNPLNGITYPKAEWHDTGIIRPYVLALTNLYFCGPQQTMNAQEAVLHRKFGESVDGLPTTTDPLEYRSEFALKVMLAGYLGAFGNLPKDTRYNGSIFALAA